MREDLAGLNNPALISTCARLGSDRDEGSDGDAVAQATRITLGLLAQRIEQLTGQMRELQQRMAF